jgi:hypothetical protein
MAGPTLNKMQCVVFSGAAATLRSVETKPMIRRFAFIFFRGGKMAPSPHGLGRFLLRA